MQWTSIYSPMWQRRFAWTPVLLDSGRVVWLERYEQRYVKDRHVLERMFGPNTKAVGVWEIRKGLK